MIGPRCHETDVALEYIDNHAGKDPFALFISWNPPHSPYESGSKGISGFVSG